MTFNTMHYKDKHLDTDEIYILLEEQEIKIANLICENYKLKSVLERIGGCCEMP